MRFGRILLAILAPLLSVSPALASDVTPETHSPAVDSLFGMLRSVVPAAVSIVQPGGHATAPAPHLSGLSSRPFLEPDFSPQFSAAAQANLYRIERQHFRALLRC